MKALTVFYDGECGLCSTVKGRLEREETCIAVEFVDYGSKRAEEVWPGVRREHPEREMLARSDEGEMFRGAEAWRALLGALVRYRRWSGVLARPRMQFVAERLYRLVAENRYDISRLLRLKGDALRRDVREAEAQTGEARV